MTNTLAQVVINFSSFTTSIIHHNATTNVEIRYSLGVSVKIYERMTHQNIQHVKTKLCTNHIIQVQRRLNFKYFSTLFKE